MKTFHLPDLGEGLAEAEIREWYVKEGDTVKVDQPLVSMETAKAVVDVPSPYAGIIKKLHGSANEIVKTGAPFITFDIGEEVVNDKPKGSVVGSLEESSKKWDEGNVIIGTAKSASKFIKAMPAARVLAQQLNVDLSSVTPTGPQGLITPDDVKQFIGQKGETARPSASTSAFAASAKLPGETEKIHGVRRSMALAMAQSHSEVVPVTIIEDADITHLPAKADLTALLLHAMVQAAKDEPSLNAWFDGKTLERKLFNDVHIGLAVDTDEGLFVPVIKNAEKKTAQDFRDAINNYKKDVKARTVSPKDLQGATITLSNFGMIAGRYATPIIVPPTVAILGCGRSREVAMPKEGKIVSARIMPLSLTFDHRAVTGGEATRFLGKVIHILQSKKAE